MNNAKKLIHMPSDTLYTGRGIGIAFLDTGIFLHRDFTDPIYRIAAFKDFISGLSGPYDDNGHGTHICGIAGGSGIASNGRFSGIAPQCHFIVGKVLDASGNGTIAAVTEGISWVIENRERLNIRVLNISIGAEDTEGAGESSVLVKSVDAAWDCGLVVVVAAGNNGPKPMSVTTPGISRKVITVGCSDDSRLVDMGGRKISNYSGRGPTRSCVIKPDIVAPGSNIMSCSNRKSFGQFTYTHRSGTSMATPIISGTAALLLEKYPGLSNSDVKMRLGKSCDDLGFSRYKQGLGRINVSRLLYAGQEAPSF